ncbi:MAG: protein kinase [Clostridia bacterium]|nr:protein kinase [Clostridia bacterium]
MGKMCYRCMKPTVEGGTCRVCGEPEMTAQGNGTGALPPGTTMGGGRLTVGKKLGSGGFGITYIAYDHKINQRVALKEFLPSYLSERQGLKIVPKANQDGAYVKAMNSFQKEARALYELRGHANIVHVISAFKTNNTAYYTMELLDGESLLSFLKKRKKISGEEAYKILMPIMSAIQYMHRRKILHRDLSPDNIMLCKDPDNSGRVVPKLIDFGAAHVAIEGFSLSYPGVKKNGFSPLEQNWDGKYQGPWTDIYSLCATFYSAVVGAVPTSAVERSEADHDPLKLPSQLGADISPAMEQVLMKGLALKYQDRIQDMGELMRQMTEAHNSTTRETIIDLPPVIEPVSTRPVGRRVGAWLLSAATNGAISVFLLTRVRSLEDLLAYRSGIEFLPILMFLINLILLLSARGTFWQLIFGLKVQRDDASEARLGFGFAILYALLYPGLIGMICGISWLASGRNIGPLEKLCHGVVMRRKEMAAPGLGAVMISRSISKPASNPIISQSVKHEGRKSAESIKAPSAAQNPSKMQGTPPRPQADTEKRQPTPAAQSGQEKLIHASSGQGQNPPKGPALHLLITKTGDTMAAMQGKVLTVHDGETIGKNGAKAKVVLSDPTISGLHCRFLYREGRGWAVKDENSTNGTHVGDQRLPSGGMAPIKSGTSIRVGKVILEVRA